MAKTRGNGSGSISPHKDGWRLRWVMPDGSRRSKVVGRMSRTSAERLLNEIVVDVARGDYQETPSRRVRFDAFAKEYLDYREPQISLGTYRNNLSYLNRPLASFSKLYMDQINQRTVDLWWSRQAAHPVNRRNAYFALRKMFKVAVKWGYVSAIPFEIENAGKDVSVPRPDWTMDDFDLVLTEVDPFYVSPLEVMFSAHLRLGELVALNGADYRDGAVNVSKQRTEQGLTTDTKTGQHATTKLMGRGVQATEARPRVIGTAPLFAGVKAARMPRKSLQDAWNKACEGAGLVNFHVHDIRHIGLSLVAESGAAEKVVQQRARHASSTSTKRYIHTSKRQHEEAVVKLDQLVNRLRKSS